MRIRDVLDNCVDGNCGKIMDYEMQEKKGRRESRKEKKE